MFVATAFILLWVFMIPFEWLLIRTTAWKYIFHLLFWVSVGNFFIGLVSVIAEKIILATSLCLVDLSHRSFYSKIFFYFLLVVNAYLALAVWFTPLQVNFSWENLDYSHTNRVIYCISLITILYSSFKLKNTYRLIYEKGLLGKEVIKNEGRKNAFTYFQEENYSITWREIIGSDFKPGMELQLGEQSHLLFARKVVMTFADNHSKRSNNPSDVLDENVLLFPKDKIEKCLIFYGDYLKNYPQDIVPESSVKQMIYAAGVMQGTLFTSYKPLQL